MANAQYFQISIDDQELDTFSLKDIPLSISYKLEDRDDFQSKKSSEALSIKVPATLINDRVFNTFHNPGVEDLTLDESYKRLRRCVMTSGSSELFVGKCILTNAEHDSRPLSYEIDCYGNNADWIIDLQESTLYDFLKHISFPFTKQQIIDSWQFDGKKENLPFVFAPVRYGEPMADGVLNYVQNPPPIVGDFNMKADYMKPSISKYWIIYWALKSVGYRLQSTFMDTDYFRRQLMPWTWGNFLYSEGTRQDNLRFLAKGTGRTGVTNYSFTGFWNSSVTNDSTVGAYDNNGVYEYVPPYDMQWTYLNAFQYGVLDATFHLQVNVDATVTGNSDAELRVQWFKNGVRSIQANDNGSGTELVSLSAPPAARRDFQGLVDVWATIRVSPGDVVTAKIYLHTFDSGLGRAFLHFQVDAFELEYFRIPLGGTIDFSSYLGFKKYKSLDFLRGVIDEFNLSIQTDPINKVVYIEPTHPYSIHHDQSVKNSGYFNNDFLDWNDKQDLSKISKIDLFKDADRELIFKYKNDSSDGILKVIQDRNSCNVTAAKYAFPSRFKNGKKEIENRFFSPVMHYDVEQWKSITGVAPQMIVMVPENISNTSRDEAQNTFSPKSVYYKGLINDLGWVFEGERSHPYPFMFAVNYKPGGENDPILSYSDERIGTDPSFVVGKGLLRRFYLQRMAIMRNGQNYSTSFRLNNTDISNFLHREHIICRGQRWELVEINGYKPLKEESTECFLRKWVPLKKEDDENVFPSARRVLNNINSSNSFDINYAPLLCLTSDIPK